MNELDEAAPCPTCGTLVSRATQWFCGGCTITILKYGDQNDVILRPYLDEGFAQLAKYLARRAEFATWLTHHPRRTP